MIEDQALSYSFGAHDRPLSDSALYNETLQPQAKGFQIVLNMVPLENHLSTINVCIAHIATLSKLFLEWLTSDKPTPFTPLCPQNVTVHLLLLDKPI